MRAASGPAARRRPSRRSRPARSARPSAEREHRDAVAWPPGARPSGCACPPGRRTGRGPRRGCAAASRNASTSAAAAVDRVDAAVAGDPADDRPVEHLLLAEPVDPPAERAASATSRDDRHVEVRAVVGGEDDRALARDRVDRALDADAGQTARDAGRDQRRGHDGRSSGVDRAARSRRAPASARGSALIGVPIAGAGSSAAPRRRRIAPTTAATVSLERVAVGRDDPGVAAAIRSGATARVVSSSSRRRSASRIASRLGARRGRCRAPRPAAARAPRPRRRGRSSGRRRAGRPCRCRGRP